MDATIRMGKHGHRTPIEAFQNQGLKTNDA